MIGIDMLLAALAGAWLVPAVVLFCECTLALFYRAPRSTFAPRPPLAVLLPAHDEELVIREAIASLRPQLSAQDKLLVVADNCTDDTARVARAAGATVVERSDPVRRGKGYALEYGVRHLSVTPPSLLIVLDADCALQDGALDRLARAAAASGRPVQAANVVLPLPGAGPLELISVFAFRVKNVVRPRGLARVGLPCQLTGTGMAFPWPILRDVSLGTAAIAEDLELGVDLAVAGHPPLFCSEAVVTSPTPPTAEGTSRQRRRWEHGHLSVILTRSARILAAAVKSGRLDLVALAVDLSVPPLSLLVWIWVGLSLLALGWALTVSLRGVAEQPSLLPVQLLAVGGTLMAFAIGEAWLVFGRQDLPFAALLRAPLYVFRKLPLYLAYLGRRERRWIRTARDIRPRGDRID